MSPDPQKDFSDESAGTHGLVTGDSNSIGESDIVFDCPSCHKGLVVHDIAAGHTVTCPLCGNSIAIPNQHRVVTLAEDPETEKLHSKPAWEQELLGIESAMKESRHQRQEAGNAYKHHASEANRLQLRMEKLDVKIRELEARLSAIRTEHPSKN